MPLFIYTDSIEKNVDEIRKYTNRKIIAVMKSNAYELGSKKIIPILRKKGVDFFAFEKCKEYFENIEVCKNTNVLIMESIPTNKILKINNKNVRISINSCLDAFYIRNLEIPLKVHLRIDSGMNRLGLQTIEEVKWVLNILKKNKNIEIEGIYTHFSSDVYENKYFEKQYETFKKFLQLDKFKIIHANATKTLNHKLIGNYVRVGMGLYGYHQPFIKLTPTISYNVRPCSLFYPKKNKKVGYSQKYVKQKIGVIPIGYHDIDLTNMSKIYYKGKTLPLIGTSCMNHTHFKANDEINYLSWLSILPTNGIINIANDYNWYKILASLRVVPKSYIRRNNYDIPKIFKYSKEKGPRAFTRIRSNQITRIRII